MAKKILIVEDEAAIRDFLTDILEDAGYDTDTAENGMDGLFKFQNGKYDLVLLDIMLPKIDGHAVLEMVRKRSDVPVIFLTAMGAEADEIKGFDLMADDYIVKPSTAALIVKRVEAAFRRSGSVAAVAEGRAIIVFGELLMDTERYTAAVSGSAVPLTLKEFELLKLLLENKGKVLTREMLLDQAWGIDYYGDDRVVNVHMANLRKKLGGSFIETVRGVGYKIHEAD